MAAVRVATVTVSDTRTPADDEGGARLRERLEAAGLVLGPHAIVRDEPDAIRAAIARVCDEDLADVIVTTGGTGIAERDRTYEAIEGLLEKKLDGSRGTRSDRARSCRAPWPACIESAWSWPSRGARRASCSAWIGSWVPWPRTPSPFSAATSTDTDRENRQGEEEGKEQRVISFSSFFSSPPSLLVISLLGNVPCLSGRAIRSGRLASRSTRRRRGRVRASRSERWLSRDR
jgi:molybdenum cofactor synthesis domain-containing protein